MSEEIFARARRGYELFARRDLATLAGEHFAPDIVWEEWGGFPDARTVHGREAVLSYLRDEVFAIWESFDYDIEEMRVQDERLLVAVLARARGRESGIEVSARVVHRWTMDAERLRATRVEVLPDMATALAGA